MLNWEALITTLTLTSTLVAAIAWVSKAIINHSLLLELEKSKANLKLNSDYEIETLKKRLTLELEEFKASSLRGLEKYKTDLAAEVSKESRIRQEVLHWANPIFASVQDLEKRLNNILYESGYLALTENYQSQINSDWSISYSYFMQSTYYLFAQYFCWIRLLQERISFELFETPSAKDKFFSHVLTVSKSLGSYPLKGLSPCKGKDLQIFALQQRGLGEALIESDGARCIGYHKFLLTVNDPIMQNHLTLLYNILAGLTPADECRWKRLELTKNALTELAKYCEELLQLN